MNKKLIRLTESDLHRIVKESVNKVLREITDYSPHNENDAQIGQIIKLPLSSVPGIDDEKQLMFEVMAINALGNNMGFRVVIRATEEFGGRPCYGRSAGRTVGIAIKKAIKDAISQIENSLDAQQYKH